MTSFFSAVAMFSKGMTAFVSKHLELNPMTFEELEFEFDSSTLFKVNEHDLSRIDYMSCTMPAEQKFDEGVLVIHV